jgi:hypothetical protein
MLDSLPDPRIAHVQLPFNLFDWRWTEAGAIDALRARPSVNVHIRSVFLHGLLANDIEQWSAVHGVSSLAINQGLYRLAAETGRQNRADLCIAFVRSQVWIDGVLIGMEYSDQLRNNLELFSRPSPAGNECDRVYSAVPQLQEALLNPVLWAKDDSENPKSILLKSNGTSRHRRHESARATIYTPCGAPRSTRSDCDVRSIRCRACPAAAQKRALAAASRCSAATIVDTLETEHRGSPFRMRAGLDRRHCRRYGNVKASGREHRPIRTTAVVVRTVKSGPVRLAASAGDASRSSAMAEAQS